MYKYHSCVSRILVMVLSYILLVDVSLPYRLVRIWCISHVLTHQATTEGSNDEGVSRKLKVGDVKTHVAV